MFTNKCLFCAHISSDFVWDVRVCLHILKMAGDDNKNLTDEERRNMLWFLQQLASETEKNGLKRCAMKDAAVHFECSASGYIFAVTPAIRMINSVIFLVSL